MQAAAARGRRLVLTSVSPGRLPLPITLAAAQLARAADAGLLPLPLHGLPAPSSSPRNTTTSLRFQPHGNMQCQCRRDNPVIYPMGAACFSTKASHSNCSTEVVAELYQKMLKFVEAKTMPPNAMLWSMVSSCSNKEDIKLLFQILQKLRVFRLSKLRINANFNCHLCMRVSEACARVGALDYGLKALCKHNVYGLTPTIGSAHYLLLHAKEHNNARLMGKIMQVLQTNSLPLQPGTADIVFSICYNADRWDLLSKYARRFVKGGVQLHQAAFDIWMNFAAKVGDSESIWKIDFLRAKAVKQYTLASGFACAKGFLLERKPETAASTIQLLYENLSDKKKPLVKDELQKLVAEWPKEVIKRQKNDNRKIAPIRNLSAFCQATEESLTTDIPVMISCMANSGLNHALNLDNLALKLHREKTLLASHQDNVTAVDLQSTLLHITPNAEEIK